MKPAIRTTTTILVCILATGLVSAQSPSIIQNTRDTMNAVSSHQTAASNDALSGQQSGTAQSSSQMSASKPATHSTSKQAASTKPAVISTKSVSTKKASTKNVSTTVSTKSSAGTAVAPLSAGTSDTADTTEKPVVPDGKYAANGRRDPFISPVVSHAGGSGCSTGKKCLEIGNINLRGVVHAENGFIAVVSNNMNKAYFLRENDPVFNGYVVKITGDSIVFQETLQDRLGKTFTREVVKKITTPAV